MTDKELINQITSALENDKNFSSTLISIVLKDKNSRTIIEKMIAEETVKQINERFGKPKINTSEKFVCPDCGRLLTWRGYYQKFVHDGNNRDCVYQIDEYGDCVWNNKMREDYIKSQNKTL